MSRTIRVVWLNRSTSWEQPRGHNFHQNADADWIWFDVVSDTTYIIQTANPMTNADTVLNLYSGCPIGGLTPLASDSNPYGREARITWKASLTGTVFASVTDDTSTIAGADTGYNLSVRASEQLPVAIIVVSDVSSATLQAHLDRVGDTAYRTFLSTRMLKDNIRYFGPDPSRDVDDNGLGDDIIGPPDPLAVRDAIQDWARTRGVGLGVPFYVVLVGDGSTDEFLAEGASSTITAENLNLWLSNLEATSGADNINVIIEASKSGSFIDVTTAGPAMRATSTN